MAEGAPDSAARDYIYRAYAKSSTALRPITTRCESRGNGAQARPAADSRQGRVPTDGGFLQAPSRDLRGRCG